MVEYIKELAKVIPYTDRERGALGMYRDLGKEYPSTYQIAKGLSEEVERLDPRDFEPTARHEFVVTRIKIRSEVSNSNFSVEIFKPIASAMLKLLDSYRGPGSGAITRSFSFMANADVRSIVERDYAELKLRAYPDGAWKSTVILAGGVLEAVLYDQLTKDATILAKTISSAEAPKHKGKTKDILKHDWENEWKLSDLIRVAADINIISKSNEDSVDEVLREYRNFVHPRVEILKGVSISEGHAMSALGSLEVILDKLKYQLILLARGAHPRHTSESTSSDSVSEAPKSA